MSPVITHSLRAHVKLAALQPALHSTQAALLQWCGVRRGGGKKDRSKGGIGRRGEGNQGKQEKDTGGTNERTAPYSATANHGGEGKVPQDSVTPMSVERQKGICRLGKESNGVGWGGRAASTVTCRLQLSLNAKAAHTHDEIGEVGRLAPFVFSSQ